MLYRVIRHKKMISLKYTHTSCHRCWWDERVRLLPSGPSSIVTTLDANAITCSHYSYHPNGARNGAHAAK